MSTNKIYSLLPPFMQDLVVTFYSYWVFSKKYNKEVEPFLIEDLQESDRSGFESHFQNFISSAIADVPFYKNIVNKSGINRSEINIHNYKKIFPIISKDEIRDNPEAFYSQRDNVKTTLLFTSGTSGSPLKIKSSLRGRKRNYAFYQAILNKYGVTLFSESATFAGRVLFSKVVSNRYWRRDRYLNTTYFSTYHMSEASLAFYVKELNRRKPVFIDSYPSSLSVLAKYIIDHKVSLSFVPRLILTSSESLDDRVKNLISLAFNGAPIVDYYGCTEMAVMAYSEGGCYRFPPHYGLVEFVPIGDEIYKIVCTGLVNDAMPLIRYEIGDVCYRGTSKNYLSQECETIIGREDDIIVTPEGAKIGRMDPVFKGISGIDKAQIVQEALDKLVVNVVLHQFGGHLFDKEQLKNNIVNRVGNGMMVEVRLVETIPLTKSGKFRAVISNI